MKKIIQKLASKHKKKKELKSKDDENFARLTKQEGEARKGYDRAIRQVKTALYPKREKKHSNETWTKPRMKKAKEEGNKEHYKRLKSSLNATPQADIRDIVKSVKRGKKEDAHEAKLNEYRERLGKKKKKTTGWKK
jgi:hypothetical protein